MSSTADVAGYSADGSLQLVVEVKAIKGVTDDWAAKLRRNLLAHRMVPTSRFFLLVTPDTLYLWRDGAGPTVAPPDYKAPAASTFARYLGSRSPRDLSRESLDLVVRFWLDDLANSELTREAAGPELGWLLDSGLYDSIKHGSVGERAAA